MIRTVSAVGVLFLAIHIVSRASHGQEGQILPWQKRLEGTWVREKAILSGKELTTKTKTTLTIVFRDNQFTRKSGEKVTSSGTYKLDMTGFPLMMEMTATGGLAVGKKNLQYALSVTEDTLIMVLPSTTKGVPGAAKIDSLDPGPGRAVYFYRRVKE